MMAKERSDKERKEKKEKKEKRSEKDGVHKKEKKEKKEKKARSASAVAEAIEEQLDVAPQAESTPDVEMIEEPLVAPKKERVRLADRPIGALVPFANPLADEKTTKKLLKGVNKGKDPQTCLPSTPAPANKNPSSAARARAIKRGVKEVVKVLRKSPAAKPSAPHIPGIVILAADISPMDVISHLPVLCEDHGVPYIYVQSRAELGAAGSTKRPTSVVFITESRAKGGRKKGGEEGEGDDKEKEEERVKEEGVEREWRETYRELLKVVQKEARNVRI